MILRKRHPRSLSPGVVSARKHEQKQPPHIATVAYARVHPPGRSKRFPCTLFRMTSSASNFKLDLSQFKDEPKRVIELAAEYNKRFVDLPPDGVFLAYIIWQLCASVLVSADKIHLIWTACLDALERTDITMDLADVLTPLVANRNTADPGCIRFPQLVQNVRSVVARWVYELSSRPFYTNVHPRSTYILQMMLSESTEAAAAIHNLMRIDTVRPTRSALRSSLTRIHTRDLEYQQVMQLAFANLTNGDRIVIGPANKPMDIVCTDIFPVRIRMKGNQPILEASETFEGLVQYVSNRDIRNPTSSSIDSFQVHGHARSDMKNNTLFTSLTDVYRVGGGEFGVVYAGAACVSNTRIPVAIKIARLPLRYLLDKNDANSSIRYNENTNDMIALWTVSQFAKQCVSPAFPLVYYSFLGYDLSRPLDAPFVTSYAPTYVTIMQRGERTVRQLLCGHVFGNRYDPKVVPLMSCNAQFLLGLSALSRVARMRHLDAHTNNWIVQSVPKDSVLVYRTLHSPRTYYCVPTCGMRLLLIDYGFAEAVSIDEAMDVPVAGIDIGRFIRTVYASFDLDTSCDSKQEASQSSKQKTEDFFGLLTLIANTQPQGSMEAKCAAVFAELTYHLLTTDIGNALFDANGARSTAFDWKSSDLFRFMKPFEVSAEFVREYNGPLYSC